MIYFAETIQGQRIGFRPDRLIQERLLIQGASGSGKSYLLRRILESALELPSPLPMTILDPEGEFKTLADSYPITYLKASDLEAPPSRAAVAESCARHRQSLILDLSTLNPEDRPYVVSDYLQTAIDLPRSHWHNRLIVIDEAHELAPQVGSKNPARAAIARLAALGRKRGLALIAATQRISKLHKDVAAELRNVLIGQTTLDADTRKSLETLALPCTAPNRQLVKSLAYQFLPFGPSLGFAPTTNILRAFEPFTRPPESGIKTAELHPHRLQVTHYIRRGGWRSGLDFTLTHATNTLTVADYLSACLYLDDHCVQQNPEQSTLRALLASAFHYLDNGRTEVIPDNANPNESYLWIYWGNGLPVWMSYRHPYRPPQPVDRILNGHSTYRLLQSLPST